MDKIIYFSQTNIPHPFQNVFPELCKLFVFTRFISCENLTFNFISFIPSNVPDLTPHESGNAHPSIKIITYLEKYL